MATNWQKIYPRGLFYLLLNNSLRIFPVMHIFLDCFPPNFLQREGSRIFRYSQLYFPKNLQNPCQPDYFVSDL